MRPHRPAVSTRLIACAAGLATVIATLVAGSPAGAAEQLPVVYNVLSARPGPAASPPGANDFSCRPSAAHPHPVVLVHGLGATAAENWGTMSPLLKNNGYCVFALTYGLTPGNEFFGGAAPMEQSSAELKTFVDKVLATTGARKVDLVGHSEGTVMPQYYLKFRGGAAKVDKYVAMTPIYKGTTINGIGALITTLQRVFPQYARSFSSLIATQCGSCEQFLKGSPFLTHLYRDGVYAVPGVTYTTIMTKFDELVTPYTSGRLDAPNATNLVVQNQCSLDFAEHLSVAFDPTVGQDILNALDPAHKKAVPCRLVLPAIGAPLG